MKKVLLFSLLFILMAGSPVRAAGDDFHLPYPGMLPTNPLYVLKVVRDNLLLVVTQNPVNRAELLVFLSNKSLATALALSKGGHNSQAAVSLQKSLTYLSEAVRLLPKATPQSRQSLNLAVIIAVRGQQQLGKDIIAKAPASSQSRLEKDLDFLENTRVVLLKDVLAKVRK